jgi:predicted nucleic acid-binding protein
MTAGTGETGAEEALADTSLFVTVEQERPLSGPPPKRVAVSVITVGELRLGVLAADSGPIRARRLETLSAAEALDPLPIDAQVAHAWAALRLALRRWGEANAHQRLLGRGHRDRQRHARRIPGWGLRRRAWDRGHPV